MDEHHDYSGPDFIQGTQVAQSRGYSQPGFEGQMPLVDDRQNPRRKLYIAAIVILAVFLAGMIAGSVLAILT